MHATASETLVLSIFHNMIYTSFTSSCFHIHVHICVSKSVAFMCMTSFSLTVPHYGNQQHVQAPKQWRYQLLLQME